MTKNFLIYTLTKYYSDVLLEKNEMGGTCSTYVETRVLYRFLVGKPEGKRPLGRPRIILR
jgi:hypothetical protein